MTIETQDPTVDRIRTIMGQLGLTQKEMAAYLGVSHSTFCNWIQGIRQPPPVAVRLLDVLGTIRVFAPAIHATLMPKGK